MKDARHDKEQLVIRWLNGELTDEELAGIEKDPEFDLYRKIVAETDKWSLPWDARRAYSLLLEKRAARPAKQARTVRMRPVWSWGIAASLLAAMAVYFNLFDSQNSLVQTAAGEQKTIWLPDSSVIHLNALSEVSYNAEAWNEKHEVTLKGNAYFEVRPGDFSVHFETGTVTVLGTRFEVATRREYLSVACYEGRVQVTVQEGNQAVTLVKDQAIQYEKGGKIVQEAPASANDPAWLSGRSRFTNTPLVQVLKALEAQYDVTVNTENIDLNRRYTGEFLHNDIDIALKMVCDPLGIGYEKEGKRVILQ